jgi:AAA+ ATPase superfamily predicted ATPase
MIPLRERDQDVAELMKALRTAADGRAQLVVLSGLRRVGKTLLVLHALEAVRPEVRSVYFEATETGQNDQLRRFHEALVRDVGDLIPPGPSPQTWEQALHLVAFAARTTPVAVAIDEATYLMRSTPGFASMVQVVWDSLAVQGQPPRLALVLTGSAMGMIEDALSSTGALYQRPTMTKTILPFTPAQAYRFVGQPDPVDFFQAFAACGGYPLHLDRWDFDLSAGENLVRLAGTPGGVLLEDGSLVLASLPDNLRRTILAVGQGRSKVSEISNEVGGRPERPLLALRRARLVHEAQPLGAPRQARSLYRIGDAYLRFWLRVLSNHVQQIEGGQGPEVLRHTEGLWQEHLGWTFEEAARHHAVGLVRDGVLPAGTLVGEWWTTTGQPAQVDVLGMVGARTVALGEAKWQARALGPHELDRLAARQRLVPDPVPQPFFLLYGRGGVREEIQVGQVLGYDAAAMLS